MKHMLSALLVLAGAQAQALSCVRPDPIRAYDRAATAEAEYLILRGRFEYDPEQAAQDRTGGGFPLPPPIAAQFIGMSLTTAGFTNPIQGQVNIMPVCAGSFCGDVQPGVELIAFARRENTVYVVEADPCSAWIFPPDPVTEAALTACLRGEPCVPAP